MKTTEVDYITSNEQHVRSRIYDGSLDISDAAEELLHIEKAQHSSTRYKLKLAYEEIIRLNRELAEKHASDEPA